MVVLILVDIIVWNAGLGVGGCYLVSGFIRVYSGVGGFLEGLVFVEGIFVEWGRVGVGSRAFLLVTVIAVGVG